MASSIIVWTIFASITFTCTLATSYWCSDGTLCSCDGDYIICDEGINGYNVFDIIGTKVLGNHKYFILHSDKCVDFISLRGRLHHFNNLEVMMPKRCDKLVSTTTINPLKYLKHGLDYYDDTTEDEEGSNEINNPIAIVSLILGLILTGGVTTYTIRTGKFKILLCCNRFKQVFIVINISNVTSRIHHTRKVLIPVSKFTLI